MRTENKGARDAAKKRRRRGEKREDTRGDSEPRRERAHDARRETETSEATTTSETRRTSISLPPHLSPRPSPPPQISLPPRPQGAAAAPSGRAGDRAAVRRPRATHTFHSQARRRRPNVTAEDANPNASKRRPHAATPVRREPPRTAGEDAGERGPRARSKGSGGARKRARARSCAKNKGQTSSGETACSESGHAAGRSERK